MVAKGLYSLVEADLVQKCRDNYEGIRFPDTMLQMKQELLKRIDGNF